MRVQVRRGLGVRETVAKAAEERAHAAHLLGEAGKRGAVLAAVARKRRTLARRLAQSFVHQRVEVRIDAEVRRARRFDPRITRRKAAHLLIELGEQRATEEKRRHDDDALRPRAGQRLQGGIDFRLRDAHERRIDARKAAALGEEPHQLAKVAVGIGIARTSAHHEHRRLGALGGGER